MGFFEKLVIALMASLVVLSLERAGLLGAFLDALIAMISDVISWLTGQALFVVV